VLQEKRRRISEPSSSARGPPILGQPGSPSIKALGASRHGEIFSNVSQPKHSSKLGCRVSGRGSQLRWTRPPTALEGLICWRARKRQIRNLWGS